MTVPQPRPQSQSETSPNPPSLILEEEEPTNTAALLLPHQSLFAPPILSILRDHYTAFGRIAHWAPIRGFGRVIIVWEEVSDAKKALKEGDYLKLDVDLAELEEKVGSGGEGSQRDSTGLDDKWHRGSGGPGQNQMELDDDAMDGVLPNDGYFKLHQRKKPKPTILRLFALPMTTLNPDPSTTHLAPPEQTKNFLISPPGSPPEGWEPIIEDAPNSTTLAEDLQKALESLMLGNKKGRGGRRGSKEVILEEGGVRVEVEDTSVPSFGTVEGDDDMGGGDNGLREEEGGWGTEERIGGEGGSGAWEVPGSRGSVPFGQGGLGSTSATPSGRVRIAPTARPPI